MPIQYQCANCGNSVQTPDDSAGKKGRCPHCSHIMTIPMSSTAKGDSPLGPAAAPQQQANPFAEQAPQPGYGSQPGPAYGQGQAQYGYGQPMQAGGAQPGYSSYGGGYAGHGYNSDVWSDKSKIAAGLLGILLPGWGIHRFYLGFVGIGLLQIFVTIVTCGMGALWGLIEGILYLTGSMDRDADGRKLRD